MFIIGCNGESPTTPDPLTQPNIVAGTVYDEATSACLPEAQVEVIAGPRTGMVAKQNYDLCKNGFPAYSLGRWNGGDILRLRASATGYVSREVDWVTKAPPLYNNIEIALRRAQ